MAIAAKLLIFFIVTALAIWTPESNSKVLGDGGKTSVHETELYFQNEASYGQGSLRSYQCPFQCNRRCSQTQYRKPCLFFCNQCCSKCLCVPPGFYGNKGVCPCYNNWKTKRGGPKCP